MPRGRQFMGRNCGTGLTAQLMEEKPAEAISPCKTYQLTPEEREKYKPVSRKEKSK